MHFWHSSHGSYVSSKQTCTWVTQRCSAQAGDTLCACANTHEWEIPSKNSTLRVLCEHIPVFFITSCCWNESQIYSQGAVLKIAYTLKPTVNLHRGYYMEALLAFLGADLSGNVREQEREENKRHFIFMCNSTFYLYRIAYLESMLCQDTK